MPSVVTFWRSLVVVSGASCAAGRVEVALHQRVVVVAERRADVSLGVGRRLLLGGRLGLRRRRCALRRGLLLVGAAAAGQQSGGEQGTQDRFHADIGTRFCRASTIASNGKAQDRDQADGLRDGVGGGEILQVQRVYTARSSAATDHAAASGMTSWRDGRSAAQANSSANAR